MYRPEEDTDRERLIATLTSRGGGSFLRGWRRELDRDGSLDVNFQDFCLAAQRLGFTGDARMLFGSNTGQSKYLALEDLSPQIGALMRRFREFVQETYGGPVEMYSQFDVAGRTRLRKEEFIGACKKAGFKAEEAEFEEIYSCCDVSGDGSLSQNEVLFLEKDRNLREQAFFKAKRSEKEKHLKLMCWAYREDGLRDLSPSHRLAQRPWLAQNFEQLPMLVHHRRVEWQRETNRRCLEARIGFVRHLRDTHGNEVRAWRAGLDPHGAFQLNSQEIRSYCRKHDLNVDSGDLWKSLDKDCDGYFRLEELCVGAADVLASFQHWAHETFGSCAAIWDRQEMVNARSMPQRDGCWASQKKVLHTTFAEVLKALDWPAYHDASARNMLLTSLDLYGCSFISCSDLEWLDKWRMPEWLCAEPDPQAWEELHARIMHEYKHPLRAWRLLLDTDNSNNVSWVEFKEACEKVKFKGNIGGAWRALNERLSSSISMKEYDAESAELLNSFKDWAETNYGSVKLAFKAIDNNSTGKLSYQELRRACKNLKWQGEVNSLFYCLESGGSEAGKRFISLKEVEFLDAWEGDPGQEEQAEDELVNAALAKPLRTPSRSASTRGMGTSASLPSLHGRKRPDSSVGKAGGFSPGDTRSTWNMGVPYGQARSVPMNPAPNTAENFGTDPWGIPPPYDEVVAGRRKQEKERLHRTYHCLYAARQPHQRINRPKSLPWLKKIIREDLGAKKASLTRQATGEDVGAKRVSSASLTHQAMGEDVGAKRSSSASLTHQDMGEDVGATMASSASLTNQAIGEDVGAKRSSSASLTHQAMAATA